MEHQINIQFTRYARYVQATCLCGWRGKDHRPQDEPLPTMKHEYREHLR